MTDEKKRILYIEDEAFFARTVVTKLKESGFDADSVPDGASGLTVLSEKPHDLILLDLTLANIDGFEFLERLRQNPALRKIPVIVLTNRSSEEDRTRAHDLGVVEFMVKVQTSPNDIIRRVKELVGDPAAEQ